jgi:hypothetical protein
MESSVGTALVDIFLLNDHCGRAMTSSSLAEEFASHTSTKEKSPAD